MVYEGHVYAGVERTSNYFGKSNFASDALFDGCLDDIKIFNRGLSQAEIEIEMNAVRTPNVVGSTTLAPPTAAPNNLPAGLINLYFFFKCGNLWVVIFLFLYSQIKLILLY